MIRRKLMPDKYLLIIYVALLIAGLLAIYGAQIIHEPNGQYFENHLHLLIFMLAITILILILPDFFDLLDRIVPLLLVGTLLLLIAVLIFGITVPGSYAKRWLLIASSFTIQPSEIAKITTTIYLASVLSKKGEKLFDLKKGLFPPLIVLLLISVLILVMFKVM